MKKSILSIASVFIFMIFLASCASDNTPKETVEVEEEVEVKTGTPYYSVLDVTPTTQDWIPDYLPTANKLVAKYGGKYLARTASHEQIEGDKKDAGLRIVLEWPSKEAALSFMNDPEYAPHFKNRTEGSVSHHYLIEGKDDLK